MNRNDFYRIGRIGKPHGVKGEVTFMFDDDVFDRVEADFVMLEVEGLLVPFFFEEYRFRSDSVALVKFEDVDTQEKARRLTNCEVFFPRDMATGDDEEMTWSFFVGYEVVDAGSGRSVGRIVAVDDSTPNVLFCLEGDLLIPANEDLINDINNDGRLIVMNLPGGLI